MKRLVTLLITLSLLLILTACGSKEAADETPIRVAGLKGPTSMGLVKLMELSDSGQSEHDYSFTLYGSADEVTPKLIKGELDMAAIPANLASVLYNNTNGQIRVLAINTLGVLYIVETGTEIKSLADLKGKIVYATGKGSTPEYTLRFLLSESGIDPDTDLTLEFKSEPSEVVALLASQPEAIAMLPEPYIAVAQTKIETLRIAVDLTATWNSLGLDSRLITGVLVGRSAFLNEHPQAAATFLKEYENSIDWVVNNKFEAADLIERYDIVKAAVAATALPYCNITFLKGEPMKTSLEGYLATLFEQNPKAVGGKLPAEDFYFIEQ